MRFTLCSSLSLLVLAIPLDGYPQDCVETAEFAHVAARLALPSRASVLAVDGDFVYLKRLGVDVVDVSNPQVPKFVGQLDSPCCDTALVIGGDFAYGVNKTQNIAVLDLSNRRSPVLVNNVLNTGDIATLALSRGHLYVASDSGLTVYDLASPIEPRRVGGIESPDMTHVRDLSISGDFVYALGRASSVPTSYSSLLVIDVSNPQTPRLRSGLDPIFPSAVAAAETHVFVSNYNQFQAIDVTDPDFPRIVDTINVVTEASGIAIDGNRAYLHGPRSVAEIVDIEDPTDMRVAGYFEARGSLIVGDRHTFAVYHGLCRANDWYDLLLISSLQPVPPGPVGRHEITGQDIAMDGERAYVASRTRLDILDLSNPELPQHVGGIQTSAPVWSIDARGDHVYAAGGDAGLFVYDVSQASQPREVAHVETPHSASVVALQDDFAYVADYQFVSHSVDTTRVLVFDVAIPTNPVLVGEVPFRAFPRAMAVEGNTVAVVEFGGHIIDVSDPARPVHRGARTIWDGAGGVDVGDKRAYAVATTHGCLDVIDFGGADLYLTSRMGSLHGCTDIVLADSYAYVMCTRGGLKVIDLSNPQAPKVDRVLPLAADPRALAVSGNLIAVTGDSGTEIFLANCPVSTTVALEDLTATVTEFSVVLRWRADPSGFVGFEVFRAEQDGVYEPLNEHAPVSGAGPWTFVDSTVRSGRTYSYKLLGLRSEGGTSALGPIVVTTSLTVRGLEAIQPNPTTGPVTLRFSLARPEFVRATVYDVAGRLVRDVVRRPYPVGLHAALWDGQDARGRPAASGIYLIRVDLGRSSTTERVVLVR